MRLYLLALVMMLPICACAEGNEPDQCEYFDEMIVSQVTKGGHITQYDAKRVPVKQGDESVFLEHLTLANGDDITIEQSYCYVYIYTLIYRLSGEKKPTSLGEILPTLGDLISKSYAGEYLTEQFSEIVLGALTMQQKMLKTPFS